MALVLKDRVKEQSTTTGTGTLTLSGAFDGYQAFSVIGNGNVTYYTIYDPATGDWEVGIGTYTASGTTLSRDTVLASSNSGSLVPFTTGTKEVFCTYPAEKGVWLDSSDNVVQNDYVDLSVTGTATINAAALTTGTVSTTPSNSTDIANKQYVDTLVASGITYHTPVKYEVPNTTGNLNATYNNGTSGVGATLTNAGTQTAFTPDGVVAQVGDRVLIYNQTNAAQNGVYTVTTVGSGSTNWVLTRSTDTDSYGLKDPNALGEGDAFFITSGNTGAGETYVCNTVGTITFGTTPITFTQVSSTQVYSAGTGLTLTNTTFSITNTGTAGTYGSASQVPVFTTNGQGQVTSVTNTSIGISASQVTSGTLDVVRGGTGLSSYAVGDIVYASGTGTLAGLADVATGNVLLSGGTNAAPSYGKVNLGTHITGTLPLANGGTGETSAQAAINSLAGAVTSGYYLRGNGTNVVMAAISAGDVPTLNQNTTGSAGSVANALTMNNGGAGDASGSTYNGSAARTISYNTIGASPLAGSTSLTTTGTVTTGTWSGLFGAVSGANLTNLTAGNLSGTIPSAVLGNSTVYIGTTATALNRGTGNQALTGISSVTLPGSTSGTVQVIPAATAGTGTVFTIPATTGTAITTGDTGTVTNTMLAGSIANAKLANSSVTINGSAVSLGGSITVTATASNALTIGSYLTGGSYNGSAAVTIAADATSANTASKLVARDASGNFSAGTITAALSGNATTATNISNTGTVTLATATESNSIYITAPSYATDQPVKLLNFDWYGNLFSLGNIRSGSTPSSGFGVYYTASGGSRTEIARFGTGGTFNTVGAITQNGSQVLTAGNYNSYAPSLTGSGASGTWGINVSGNAATATTATNQNGGTVNATTGVFSNGLTSTYGQGKSSLNAIGGNIGSTTPAWNNSQLEVRNNDAGTVAIAFHRAGYSSNTLSVTDGNGIRIDGNIALSAGNYSGYCNFGGNAVYGGIYYDGNNTGYYCDPASTSNLNAVNLSSIGTTFTCFPGQTSALAFENQTSFFRFAFNDLRFYEWDGGGDQFGLNGGYAYCNSSFRAPIFYDYNNTGYYADPASTSNFSVLVTQGRLYSKEWIQMDNYSGLYSPLNDAHLYPNDQSYGAWRVYGSRNGWGGFEFTNGSNGAICLMTGSASSESGLHNPAYGWQILWSGGALYSGRNSYGGNTSRVLQDDLWINSKYFGSDGAIYGTIFYDANNSGYYCDPNGTSNFNAINKNGYGMYACRAWVNFNGTFASNPFTIANGGIRGAENVSSVTDNGTGDYTVNFSTAMADANYSAIASFGNGSTQRYITAIAYNAAPTASAIRCASASGSNALIDPVYCYVAVFR